MPEEKNQTGNKRSLTSGIGKTLLTIGLYIVISKSVAYLFSGRDVSGTNRIMPRDIAIQEGYVKPSEIEIKLTDLDGDGKNETIMKVGGEKGTNYLIKYNKDGIPTLQKYVIKSDEVVPIQVLDSKEK